MGLRSLSYLEWRGQNMSILKLIVATSAAAGLATGLSAQIASGSPSTATGTGAATSSQSGVGSGASEAGLSAEPGRAAGAQTRRPASRGETAVSPSPKRAPARPRARVTCPAVVRRRRLAALPRRTGALPSRASGFKGKSTANRCAFRQQTIHIAS